MLDRVAFTVVYLYNVKNRQIKKWHKNESPYLTGITMILFSFARMKNNLKNESVFRT